MRRNILGLTFWIGLCFLAAAAGSLIQSGTGSWYAGLEKPAWTPPGYVFGPVWTILYAMMGAAAWLIWKQAGQNNRRAAITAFCCQLVLNAAWTPLFFGLQRPGLALLDLLALVLALVVTVLLFWRVRVVAALLLLPYLVWVLFAAALNYQILILNS